MKFKFICGGISYEIPERMRSSLLRYIERGTLPGDFLTAVLRNDLHGALSRADEENMQNLPAYMHFLYNYAPSECWGSKEKVKAWFGSGGRNRTSLPGI